MSGAGRSVGRRTPATVTRSVWVLAAAALAVFFSAIPAARPIVGGLAVHPYVFVLGLIAPLLLTRLGSVPRRLLAATVLLSIAFIICTLPVRGGFAEIVKWGGFAVSLIAVPALARSERDVVLLIVCLAAAVGAIAARGLVLGALGLATDSMGGINVMPGIGNKNGFSLYALPTMLVAGWAYTRLAAGTLQRGLLLASLIVMAVAVFSTANRSGWLGVVLVALMILYGRLSLRTVTALATAAVVVYLVIGGNEATQAMLERRTRQTTGENSSDEMRRELVRIGVEIGLDNPFIGVSPQRVARNVALRLHTAEPVVETHNVYAYVFAGCGLLGVLAFAWFSFAAAWPWGRRAAARSRLLPIMVVTLWWFRGMFTHETLYSPTFALALGIATALIGIEIRAARAPAAQPSRAPRPSHAPRPARPGGVRRPIRVVAARTGPVSS